MMMVLFSTPNLPTSNIELDQTSHSSIVPHVRIGHTSGLFNRFRFKKLTTQARIEEGRESWKEGKESDR